MRLGCVHVRPSSQTTCQLSRKAKTLIYKRTLKPRKGIERVKGTILSLIYKRNLKPRRGIERVKGTILSDYVDNFASSPPSLGSWIFNFSIRYLRIRRLVPSSEAALV